MSRVTRSVRALLSAPVLLLLCSPLRAADAKDPSIYAPVVNATNHFAVMNRPFFFAVIDTRTDQTLFMGTVVEP